MPDFATTLFALLTTGAGLAASGAVTEFAKGAGKTALDALKSRLTGADAKSVALIEAGEPDPAYADLIQRELARPAVAEDLEVRALARQLEAAIEALPDAAKAPYAVRIREIRAGKSLLFENVQGVQADTATSQEDMTFRGVTSPGKG